MPDKVQKLSTQLSEALAGGELDLSVQMGRLQSPKVAREIINNVMTRFVEDYDKVYQFVQQQIQDKPVPEWETIDIGTFHRPNVLATLLL